VIDRGIFGWSGLDGMEPAPIVGVGSGAFLGFLLWCGEWVVRVDETVIDCRFVSRTETDRLESFCELKQMVCCW